MGAGDGGRGRGTGGTPPPSPLRPRPAQSQRLRRCRRPAGGAKGRGAAAGSRPAQRRGRWCRGAAPGAGPGSGRGSPPAVAINPSGVSSVAEPGMEARQGEGGQGRPREPLTKGTRPCARGEGRSAGRDARRRAGAVGRSGDATCSVALSFRRQGLGGRERRRRLRGTGEGGPAAASRSSSCTRSGGILGRVVPGYISMHKHPAERYINGWMGPRMCRRTCPRRVVSRACH